MNLSSLLGFYDTWDHSSVKNLHAYGLNLLLLLSFTNYFFHIMFTFLPLLILEYGACTNIYYIFKFFEYHSTECYSE